MHKLSHIFLCSYVYICIYIYVYIYIICINRNRIIFQYIIFFLLN